LHNKEATFLSLWNQPPYRTCEGNCLGNFEEPARLLGPRV